MDSRYLESPEEEEEPEEEGDSDTDKQSLNQAFSFGQNVLTYHLSCPPVPWTEDSRPSWLCGRSESGVSTSSRLSGISFGATPSSSKRLMLSVWS